MLFHVATPRQIMDFVACFRNLQGFVPTGFDAQCVVHASLTHMPFESDRTLRGRSEWDAVPDARDCKKSGQTTRKHCQSNEAGNEEDKNCKVRKVDVPEI